MDKACIEIEKAIGNIELHSSFYQTSPWGFESNDEFINKAIVVNTLLDPNDIMITLLEIESNLGRVREDNKDGYQSRTIDLDILLIDDLIIENDLLIVPHPRMKERKFVLVPLAEMAGELIHPTEKRSITDLLNICEDEEDVTRVF